MNDRLLLSTETLVESSLVESTSTWTNINGLIDDLVLTVRFSPVQKGENYFLNYKILDLLILNFYESSIVTLQLTCITYKQ